MRTGAFRFVEERRWWRRRPRQVLFVEVSTPGDRTCSWRIPEWVRGTASDAHLIQSLMHGDIYGRAK